MISAFIPSYRQVHGSHGKNYTVFQIEVFISGKCHKIEKRYRAFHSLHKQLKNIVNAPEFPPKKVRNLNPKVLEHRRKGLENYVQNLLKRKPVPKQLLTFLSLPVISPASSVTSFHTLEDKEVSHYPVLTFCPNLYVDRYEHDSALPDIVRKGILSAFYSDDESDLN